MNDVIAFLKIDVDEEVSVPRVDYLVARCQELQEEFGMLGVPFGWSVKSSFGGHDRSPDYPNDRPELRG